MASKDLENRIRRIEILLNLEDIPNDWRVTKKRINDLEKKLKYKYQAKDKLVIAFGESIQEEED